MKALRGVWGHAVLLSVGLAGAMPAPTLADPPESAAAVPVTDQSPQPQPHKPSPSTKSEPLQELLVTGTRLGTDAQSVQELHIYDSTRIAQSGQSTVTDFLATLPEVSLNSVESSYLATTVRLRGAMPGSPLILINGRRTQPVTGGAAVIGFFDLNTIPLAMVERIEVLPNGSSAIYGGEALAGVVNIILRSDFTGVNAGAGYKWADNTNEKDLDVGGGWSGDKLSVSMIAAYTERTPLLGRDRAITASADYTPYGGPNLGSPIYGAPANVYAVSGNLPGLDSSFAAVPKGSSGVGLTPSDFAGTAGTLNTGSYTAYQSAVPELQRGGVFVSAEYRVGPAFELFAELLASIYQQNFAFSPPSLEFNAVPASNPFNPFGTTVNVAGVVQGAEGLSELTNREDFLRPLIGARGSLGTWSWEFTAIDARDEGTRNVYGQPNSALLTEALGSSNPTTALNPFIDGPMASPQVLSSIYSMTETTRFKSDDRLVDGFLRGSLLQLPAGALDAVFGAEYERSTLYYGFDAERTARSLFTELRAPLLAGSRGAGELPLLALQGAARYDHYSDFGSQTTWQMGVEFRPVESLLVRGTEATAFKPPTLYELAAPAGSFPLPVTDPLRNNQLTVVQALSGGNAQLDPTTSRTSTLGVVWSPKDPESLDVSMTWWRLVIDNSINEPEAQYIVDNPDQYPGLVMRGPAPPGEVGPITSVNIAYLNFGTMREQGIDGRVDWRLKTAMGEVTPALAVTYMSEFEGATTAGGPAVDRLSHANNDGIFAPQWKGIASVSWTPHSAVNLWLDGRYIGRYWDYTPTRTLGNVWYLDASMELGVEEALDLTKQSLGGLKFLLSGTNLANKLPPYSSYFRGYDVYNYDIIGRTFFARLQVQW